VFNQLCVKENSEQDVFNEGLKQMCLFVCFFNYIIEFQYLIVDHL